MLPKSVFAGLLSGKLLVNSQKRHSWHYNWEGVWRDKQTLKLMFVFQAPECVRLEMLSADVTVVCFSTATRTCYIIHLFELSFSLCGFMTFFMLKLCNLDIHVCQGWASEECWNMTYLLDDAALIADLALTHSGIKGDIISLLLKLVWFRLLSWSPE